MSSRVISSSLSLMLAIACLLAVLMVSVAQAKASVENENTGNIINGIPVEADSKWPWYVALERKPVRDNPESDRFLCGGSLIAPNRVLTAAHCVDRLGATDFHVRIGGGKLSDFQGSQRVAVKGITMHPQALGGGRSNSMKNDVALLTLIESVRTQPVQLASPRLASQWVAGQSATLIGHGLFDVDDSDSSDVLREAEFTFLSDQACQDAFSGISNDHPRASLPDLKFDSMICAQGSPQVYDQGGEVLFGSCFGDSGGPLLIQSGSGSFFQVGITSWGAPRCDTDYPTVFARVLELLPFIKKPDSELTYKPYNMSKLKVVGDVRVGNRLTCSSGRWGGDPARIQYTWYKLERSPNQDIEGVTIYNEVQIGSHSQTYTPTSSDVEKPILCKVRAQNAGGFHFDFTWPQEVAP